MMPLLAVADSERGSWVLGSAGGGVSGAIITRMGAWMVRCFCALAASVSEASRISHMDRQMERPAPAGICSMMVGHLGPM